MNNLKFLIFFILKVWAIRIFFFLAILTVTVLAVSFDTHNFFWSRVALITAVLFMGFLGLTLMWKGLKGYGIEKSGFHFIPPNQKPNLFSRALLVFGSIGILCLAMMGVVGLLLSDGD